MDDFLVVCRTHQEALLARAQVEEVLEELGLKRHPDKGQWEISQQILHLGMEIDLKAGKFRAPQSRLEQINRQSATLIGRALRNRRLIPAMPASTSERSSSNSPWCGDSREAIGDTTSQLVSPDTKIGKDP